MSDILYKPIKLDNSNSEIHKNRVLTSEEIDSKNIIFGFDFKSFIINDLIKTINLINSDSLDFSCVAFNKGTSISLVKNNILEFDQIILFSFSFRGKLGFIGFQSSWAKLFLDYKEASSKDVKELSTDPAIRSFLEYFSLKLINALNENFKLAKDDKIILSSDQYFTLEDKEVAEELKSFLEFKFLIKSKEGGAGNSEESSIFYFLPKTLLDTSLPRYPDFINHTVITDSFGLLKLEIMYAVIPVNLDQLVNLKKTGALIDIHENLDLSSAYCSIGGIPRSKLNILLDEEAFVFEIIKREMGELDSGEDIERQNQDKSIKLSLRIFSKEISFSEYQKNSSVIRSDLTSLSEIELVIADEVIGRGELVILNEKIHLKVL